MNTAAATMIAGVLARVAHGHWVMSRALRVISSMVPSWPTGARGGDHRGPVGA